MFTGVFYYKKLIGDRTSPSSLVIHIFSTLSRSQEIYVNYNMHYPVLITTPHTLINLDLGTPLGLSVSGILFTDII